MQIYEIDLHYHAGTERDRGKTLRDYLEFARLSGRRILGITDHSSHFRPPLRDDIRNYPQSSEGLRMYRRELDELRADFPELQIFFGPELSTSTTCQDINDAFIEVSDYFIYEPASNWEEIELYTELMLSEVAKVRAIADYTGRPAFMAHPLRSRLSRRADTGRTPPENYAGPDSLTDEEVSAFFGLDFYAFADCAKALDVGIEVNGGTLFRQYTRNHPYYRDVLCHAYKILYRRGVCLIPASDLHGFDPGKWGNWVPYELLEAIGLQAHEVTILAKLGAKLD